MPINYQNSKIYTIRSHQTDKIYIGSTVNELRKRLHQHKNLYKGFLKNPKKYHFYSSFEIIKFDDCFIELYEKYPCSDKMELHKREAEIIRSLDCVNKNIPMRKQKEYREDKKEFLKEQKKIYKEKNKEKIKQKQKEYDEKRKEQRKIYNKEYYQKNKDKIKEYDAKRIHKKFICVCGSEIQERKKNRHEKSKKHINFINNN